MKRLIPFTVIVGIYTYLAWKICVRLGYALDWISFTVAIAVAALTGLTWFTVSDWWSAATRPFQPQTVKLKTTDTPNQVVLAGLWAVVNLLFVIALIVLLILAVRYGWI
jgi:fumarate reductase subunit C